MARLVLVGSAVALASCAEAVSPVSMASADGATANAAGGGTTLYFNGVNANASTPLGTVLTTQIDNLEVDVMVRYDGPNANHSHQTVYYNGHGAVTGWGIIIQAQADGDPDGSLAILAGGIDIPLTGMTLTIGKWQHIVARRVNQQVSVTLDDRTVDLGGLGVHPVGQGYASIERTTIGGDGTFDSPSGSFNGAIDNVKVRDLANDQWIERWNFNAGQGTTTTGVNGTVLGIGNAVWARRGNP
ncbi:MAG TPA: hypothetical protein VF483_01790 [Gemmatimonadaceae bacterium]